MPRYTYEELLAHAEALDRAYAEAEAFDLAHAPTVTAYRILWDNGDSDCGEFPWTYATEAEAEAAAASLAVEMIVGGVWTEDGGCEVIAVQVPAAQPPEEDETALVRAAGLNHRGEP